MLYKRTRRSIRLLALSRFEHHATRLKRGALCFLRLLFLAYLKRALLITVIIIVILIVIIITIIIRRRIIIIMIIKIIHLTKKYYFKYKLKTN